MNSYGTLDVIREMPETDDDETDMLETFIRYTSEIPHVPGIATEKIECVADENRCYHSNYSQYVYGDKNTNTTEGRAHEIDRKKSALLATKKSGSGASIKKHKSIMEPTYRMEPAPEEVFIWFKVRDTLNKLIGPFFDSFKYQSRTAGNFCKMVCNKAITTIKKKYEWHRYRYVCHMTLFELNSQGIIVGERSLTSHGLDNYATCVFENKEIVLIFTFHGIYYE